MQQKHDKSLSGLQETSLSKYEIEMEIGRGSSGTCYRAFNKSSKEIYAIKKIPINNLRKEKQRSTLKEAMKEVNLLKSLSHSNIIKYHESFTDENNLYIVMEYASRGDLHSILKRRKMKQQFYEQKQIWEMAKQLLSALKYLHSNKIVHRDFKTLNIFVNEKNELMVGDLGVSKIIKTDLGLYTRVGTPLYLAPEIIKYEKYDYKADVWGLGCVLYLVSTLCHPFQGKNIISLGQNIVHSDPKPILGYSERLNLMIQTMLRKDPNKRPDPNKLLKDYFPQDKIPQKNKQLSPSPQKIKYHSQIRKNDNSVPIIGSKNSIAFRNQATIINSSIKLIDDKTIELEQKNKPELSSIKNTHISQQKQEQRKQPNNYMEQENHQSKTDFWKEKKEDNKHNDKKSQEKKGIEEEEKNEERKSYKYIKISDLKPENTPLRENENRPAPVKITSRPTSSLINRQHLKVNKQIYFNNKQKYSDINQCLDPSGISADKSHELKEQNSKQKHFTNRIAHTRASNMQKNRYNSIKTGSMDKLNKAFPSTSQDMQTMKNNFNSGFYNINFQSQSKVLRRQNINNCSKIYYVGEQTQKNKKCQKSLTENNVKAVKEIDEDIVLEETQLRDSNRMKNNQSPNISKTQNTHNIHSYLREKEKREERVGLNCNSIKFRNIQSAKPINERGSQGVNYKSANLKHLLEDCSQSQVLKADQMNSIKQRKEGISSGYSNNKQRPKSSVCDRKKHILRKNPNIPKNERSLQWQEDQIIEEHSNNKMCFKHTKTQLLKKPQIIFLG